MKESRPAAFSASLSRFSPQHLFPRVFNGKTRDRDLDLKNKNHLAPSVEVPEVAMVGQESSLGPWSQIKTTRVPCPYVSLPHPWRIGTVRRNVRTVGFCDATSFPVSWMFPLTLDTIYLIACL